MVRRWIHDLKSYGRRVGVDSVDTPLWQEQTTTRQAWQLKMHPIQCLTWNTCILDRLNVWPLQIGDNSYLYMVHPLSNAALSPTPLLPQSWIPSVVFPGRNVDQTTAIRRL
jgi:hypothetical protein